MTSVWSKRPLQVKQVGVGGQLEGCTAALKVKNDVGKSKMLAAKVVRNRKIRIYFESNDDAIC